LRMYKIKSNKWLLLMLCIICSFCLLTGCANSSEEEASADTRTVTDQAGREVVIPTEVNRIVTTWRPCTFLVFAVGGQEKLVGVDNGSVSTPFTKGVYPEIENVSKVGDKKSGINIEEVVAAEPDVVCVWAEAANDGVIEQLETQGIPCLVIVPESAEDMKEAAALLGEVLGTTEQAEKIVDYYDDTIAMIQERLKDVSEEERTRVYLAGAHGILSSCGSDFYQHFLIEQAGGVNVAAELQGGWQNVSPEQLVAWDPDVIIADPYCKESMEDILKMDPGLEVLQAVKNDELYSFPEIGQWSFPIPQSAMGILWLSKTIYPEQFEDIDFEEEVNSYYKDFFGVTYTELGGKNLDGRGIPVQE
jgi:iron complex transport system substrate-binding protein